MTIPGSFCPHRTPENVSESFCPDRPPNEVLKVNRTQKKTPLVAPPYAKFFLEKSSKFLVAFLVALLVAFLVASLRKSKKACTL